MIHDGLRIDGGPWEQGDKRGNALSPLLVLNANDSYFVYALNLGDDLFDFSRVDVVATANDHVALAID